VEIFGGGGEDDQTIHDSPEERKLKELRGRTEVGKGGGELLQRGGRNFICGIVSFLLTQRVTNGGKTSAGKDSLKEKMGLPFTAF